MSKPLSAARIQALLDEWLETEFTFLHTPRVAEALAGQNAKTQRFLLDWTQRIATTNIQLAYEFAERAVGLLEHYDHHLLEAWALYAADAYDRAGLMPALQVIRDVEHFLRLRHEHAVGVVLEEVKGVLLVFARGLAGRKLRIAQGEAIYTDSETLYLPPVIAEMRAERDNFLLAKTSVAFMWAQTRFGAFRRDLPELLAAYPDPAHALGHFQALESLRLEACLGRELPGLSREMRRLKARQEIPPIPPGWESEAVCLARPEASLSDSLRLLARTYARPLPTMACYHAQLRPEEVAACMKARISREKILLRVKLAQLLTESRKPALPPRDAPPPRFQVQARNDAPADSLTRLGLTLDGLPVAPPENVRDLLTSIQLDLRDIPDDYLVPAGPDEYDPALYQAREPDPDEVWQGTYHEEGAELYPEWDFGRQHYRKNWCTMREKDVPPVHDDFPAEVLRKHGPLVKHLRRAFEAMRDEHRLLKRQAYGENVDFDALVEALAEARDGREMSERLFTRMHRAERDIAVLFMVDMSGSTRGWINEAERESLILLAEALEVLGDRYGIYGFSGMTRKRCELYRIKRLDEPYNAEVKARISGIRPQDYTRMGFAIRHLSRLLSETEARTRLLVTLSDGKPDDYNDYRGAYGIEDTRRALIEARRAGIHPYCITLDDQARDYLPHLYGPAAFTVVSEVRQLPFKVSDIYRRLTR
jgi:nitric oxide reductase NorD protein